MEYECLVVKIVTVVILKIRDNRNIYSEVACKSGTFSSVRFQFRSTYYYGFDVLLDSPLLLRKGIKYCVGAIIDGPDSCFGIDGAADVHCHGVKFSFSHCLIDDCVCCCDTDERKGQFAAFLFRLK